MTTMTRSILLTFLFLCFFQTVVFAQPSVDAVALVANKSGSPTVKKYRKKTAEMPAYFRLQRAMPAVYTGLAIELVVSEMPLERDNPLFRQFGNVVTQKSSSGMFVYNVLISFRSEKEAERFTEMVIKPRAPQARLVSYDKGKLKKAKKIKKIKQK